MKHSPEVQDAIRRRADELFRRSGEVPGHDVEHWCQAEAEILREFSSQQARSAVVVSVDGVVYTGEYDSANADGYTIGEWKAGDPVPVRMAGDKLFLRRRNGHYLETIIVKRVG
jgi:hypothetical protein